MLAKHREQIVLLFGLLVLNALLAWDAHRLWGEYHQRIQWVYAQGAPGGSAISTVQPQRPAGAQNFAEIVNRNVFSPDRTNESPKDVPAPKAPELPLLYGTMNLGDGWFALMAPMEASGSSKRVLPGEEIGGYKLVSISGSQVVVEWSGKEFNINTADSVRRAPRNMAGPVHAASSSSSAGASQVTTIAPTASASSTSSMPFASGSSSSKPQSNFAAGLGAPPGAPVDAPAGTVLGGKRKVVTTTPFGNSVTWVDVEPAQKQP